MKVYAKTFDSEEQGAVVSARTSRSPNTFDVIHEEVKAKGHEAFLKTNVIGYGHDSVAEVASSPLICIEDISDLAANVVALADPQLVVQMSSTRYQDMGARTCRDMNGNPSPEGEAAKARYIKAMPVIEAMLEKTDHPKKRTLQCDIARAHLPAGVSTQFSIRGNARVMRDAVSYMLGHTLPEVRNIGEGVHAAIKEHIEVLFDRHITPTPSMTDSMGVYNSTSLSPPGDAKSTPATVCFANLRRGKTADGDVAFVWLKLRRVRGGGRTSARTTVRSATFAATAPSHRLTSCLSLGTHRQILYGRSAACIPTCASRSTIQA